MVVDWELEAPRLARLARLDVSPSEAGPLAEACDAITRDFAALTSYAEPLPAVAEGAPGALRPDVMEPPPSAEVDGILAAAPHVDRASRKVSVPRGLP